MNCLNLFLFGGVYFAFIRTIVLWDREIFLQYFKYVIPLLLSFVVFDAKSAVNFTVLPLYSRSSFSHYFPYFLVLAVNSLTKMCLSVDLSGFILLEFTELLECVIFSFEFGKFSTIISLNIFSFLLWLCLLIHVIMPCTDIFSLPSQIILSEIFISVLVILKSRISIWFLFIIRIFLLMLSIWWVIVIILLIL